MHGYKWPINCTRTRTGRTKADVDVRQAREFTAKILLAAEECLDLRVQQLCERAFAFDVAAASGSADAEEVRA